MIAVASGVEPPEVVAPCAAAARDGHLGEVAQIHGVARLVVHGRVESDLVHADELREWLDAIKAMLQVESVVFEAINANDEPTSVIEPPEPDQRIAQVVEDPVARLAANLPRRESERARSDALAAEPSAL